VLATTGASVFSIGNGAGAFVNGGCTGGETGTGGVAGDGEEGAN